MLKKIFYFLYFLTLLLGLKGHTSESCFDKVYNGSRFGHPILQNPWVAPLWGIKISHVFNAKSFKKLDQALSKLQQSKRSIRDIRKFFNVWRKQIPKDDANLSFFTKLGISRQVYQQALLNENWVEVEFRIYLIHLADNGLIQPNILDDLTLEIRKKGRRYFRYGLSLFLNSLSIYYNKIPPVFLPQALPRASREEINHLAKIWINQGETEALEIFFQG